MLTGLAPYVQLRDTAEANTSFEQAMYLAQEEGVGLWAHDPLYDPLSAEEFRKKKTQDKATQ